MNADAHPKVVWSLDFELRWGMHDLLGLDRDLYRKNLEGAREAVPQLLKLFTRRGVRATWAAVGALACHSWDDYYRRAPAPPRYADKRLAVDPRYADLDPDGVLHFAPNLVALVAETEGQDLGTHTFSHLYLGELGVMQRDATADHAATLALFSGRFGITPTSLVFPRNQVAFLAFYRARGISAWRDNENSWYYRLTRHSNHSVVRALRMMDAVTPWRARGGSFCGNRTPSTLFIRVYLPESLWKLHLARIATEARRIRQGGVLHFWLHPHNLGADVPRGIRRIEQVLDVIERDAPPGTIYASMRDLAGQVAVAQANNRARCSRLDAPAER
jgi:peptidoglycan/xylan/chitin deacetylase (PgdA/CDA1 family)